MDKRDAMLDACRAERTQMALKITDLEGRLAECEGTATPPDPPPEPPPPPPSGARTEWSPQNVSAAPGKGDFPSLDKKNVGLLDAAILTTKTGFTPAPGATYANLDIKNSFDTATGSTFRNCRITASGYWAVLDRGGAAATYEDCEFVGNPGGDACCNLNGSTYRRCYLHGSEDGAKIDAGTMIDCLLIDNKSSLSNAHYDGLQSMGGGPIKIRHCYIGVPENIDGGTSAFLVKSDFSARSTTSWSSTATCVGAAGPSTSATAGTASRPTSTSATTASGVPCSERGPTAGHSRRSATSGTTPERR